MVPKRSSVTVQPISEVFYVVIRLFNVNLIKTDKLNGTSRHNNAISKASFLES